MMDLHENNVEKEIKNHVTEGEFIALKNRGTLFHDSSIVDKPDIINTEECRIEDEAIKQETQAESHDSGSQSSPNNGSEDVKQSEGK